MRLEAILQNKVLISAFIAWMLAQLLKVPFEYLRSGRWNWALLLYAGGMPSSHSALMVGTTHAIGLHYGFDSPIFALALAMSMIVIYDAAGVRRQAGIHAERINYLFDELMKGHMWSDKELREVIGHTPLEVVGGVLLGIAASTVFWMIWG
ncbi:MAG: divergent PAP2 family protein [Bacteroidota bacterium]